MEFQTIPINQPVPNDYNPNEMTNEEFDECKKEIARLGTLPKPVVVRPTMEEKNQTTESTSEVIS